MKPEKKKSLKGLWWFDGKPCPYKGIKRSDEVKQKLRVANIGKKHTEEAKRKMKEAKLLNPTRYWLGKKLPSDMTNKMSKANKGRLAWNKGISVPQNSGENCYNWKGGITKETEKIRKSVLYKAWRTAVFVRDNFICVHCKKVGGSLNAHHLLPFALFPEKRFDVDNGITLCVKCHKKVHSEKA